MKAFKVLRKFNGKKMKVNPNNPLKSLNNTENPQFRFFIRSFPDFGILWCIQSMQGWKKQILKKNRLHSHEEITREQATRQNILYECIDKMQNHFCRLLSFYIRLKHTQNHLADLLDYSVLQEVAILAPEDLNIKQENKLVHTLYRRVKLVLANFQNSEIFIKYFDEVLDQQRDDTGSLLQQFFKLGCAKIIKQIQILRKQKEQQIKSLKMTKCTSTNLQLQTLKTTHKKNSQILCETIYNNLELQQIEACFLLIQEASLTENINYVYERIKSRNKKTAKQISVHQKKIGNKKYQDLRSYLTKQKAKTIISLHTTKKISISKSKAIKIDFRSLSKSLSKKNLGEKSKLKLDPLIKRDKIKLKLLR